MKTRLYILLLFIIPQLHAQETQKGIQFRNITFEQALKASQKEGKMVFMHGYASWCHLCQYMKDSVYTDSSVGAYFNSNFICFKIDLEKEGAELNKTLKSHTFPCLVFYDSNGEVVHRASGRYYKPMFMELAKEAQDPRRQLRSWMRVYNNGNVSADTAYQVIRKMEVAAMETQPELMKYINRLKQEDITKPENWKIIKDCFKSPESPFMQTLIDKKKELEGLYGKKEVNDKFMAVYAYELYMRNRLLDSLGYDALKKKIMATNLDIKEMICIYADMGRYRAASQYDKYFETAVPFVSMYALDNKDMIYEVSQFFYEKTTDRTLLTTAKDWMNHCLTLEDSYKNNILLCGLYIQLGDKQSAKTTADHAMELAAKTNASNRLALLMLDKIEQMQ